MKYLKSDPKMETFVRSCFGFIILFTANFNTYAGHVAIDIRCNVNPLPAGVALPLRLVSFNAKSIVESSVLLEWKTLGENNTDYFDVERSMDAINFIKVGTMKAAGIDPLNRSYNFTDAKPTPGNNYYRLSMYDLDGSVTYSATQVIKVEAVRRLNIFPNPANNSSQVNLYWKTIDAGSASISIYELTGKQVYKGRIGASAKSLVPIGNWAAGVYGVMLDDGNRKEFTKLIVEKR